MAGGGSGLLLFVVQLSHSHLIARMSHNTDFVSLTVMSFCAGMNCIRVGCWIYEIFRDQTALFTAAGASQFMRYGRLPLG